MIENPDTPIISIRDLCKSYGPKQVLNHITLAQNVIPLYIYATSTGDFFMHKKPLF